MPQPLPTVPTPLPEVALGAQRSRGLPLTVLASAADGALRLGPAAEDLARGWDALAPATGKAGEVYAVPAAGGGYRWLLGTGEGEPGGWRAAGAALVRAVADRAAADERAGRRKVHALQLALPEHASSEQVAALVLGAALGGYRFRVSNERSRPAIATLRLITSAPDRYAGPVRRAMVLARATGLARDLANTPSDVKDPRWLAATASRVVADVPAVEVTVRDERWLSEHGFGGMLAVGGGSPRPPRLIELRYRPRGSGQAPHLMLVGKGITFDTGGLSLKPNAGMHLMRTDMAGGGAVIAAVRAIGQLRLPLRVTGLVPAAENHVSGSAYRPGDVVRHFGGRTTQVANTDAEGRMVLADALAYGCRAHKPDYLVDAATLTGAMKVALGLRTGGLFATDDGLAERIERAGAAVGERWWRMPLSEEYAEEVRGDLADVRQAPDGPGGITAALFLREFTGGRPWAHLDIAGPARAESSYDEVVPGATGYAARTLVELAAGLCEG